MKFTVSTKPLAEGLNLGIINANVSKFYQRSTVAQIKASKAGLIINLEAAQICSRLEFKGACDSDGEEVIFVNSLLLKSLVATFESSTTTFEFIPGGLTLYSGKSKFTLAKELDADVRMAEPAVAEAAPIDIKKENWKFIKDFQLYAIGVSFIAPVYTKIWIGESGDVLTGDFSLNLFTHSNKGTFGRTCLLEDTIVNLFNALPDGAQMCGLENSFLIQYKSDSFTFVSEFRLKYETDPDMGSYKTDIIMPMIASNEPGLTVKIGDIQKLLSQADLLATSTEDVVTLSVANNQLTLKGENIEGTFDATGTSADYSLPFKTSVLKSVITNCSEESIVIRPAYNPDGHMLVGINISSGELTVVLSGADDE